MLENYGEESPSFYKGLVRINCWPKFSLERKSYPEKNYSREKQSKTKQGGRATKISLEPLDPATPEANVFL